MRQIDRFAVGGVLVDCLSVFGRNWVTFLPLLLIAFALLAIADASFSTTVELDLPFGQRSFYLFDVVMEVVCAAWLGGGLAFGVVNALRGVPASHWEVVRAATSIMPLLLIVTLVQMLIVLAGLVLLVVPGLVAMAALYVAPPAAAMRRIGPARALSRSLYLTRRWRWPLFGLVAIVVVVGFVADELACLATGVCEGPRLAGGTHAFYVHVAKDVLLGAFEATVAAVSYCHLVVLKEGRETSVVASVFD